MASENSPLAKDIIAAHNYYRSAHGVGPLKYDQEIAQFAQWADTLALDRKTSHNPDRILNGAPLGENLFNCIGKEANGQQATDLWYAEIRQYDFDHPDYIPGTGHFTQLVWKNTEFLGVGLAKDTDGMTHLVVNYSPAGNIYTKFQENVLRPIAGQIPEIPTEKKNAEASGGAGTSQNSNIEKKVYVTKVRKKKGGVTTESVTTTIEENGITTVLTEENGKLIKKTVDGKEVPV